MRRYKSCTMACCLVALVAASPACAEEAARIERIDQHRVALLRDDPQPAALWLSADPVRDAGDSLLAASDASARREFASPADQRHYLIMVAADGSERVVAERVLPLEQGSNFRDIGGYTTADGRTVRWGMAFRSGAMPLLTEADYGLLEQLDIGAVVDLRSLEEREVAADQLDDRTGALFLSNDYSLVPLMASMGRGGGENMYAGMETLLRPQFRALFNRLLADEGAVLYHCSAGQDRTGMATALIYDVLGVDRDTIVADYHRSTELRRPQFELPPLDPADFPGNPIVQYYAARAAQGNVTAEPLYTPSGQSHLVQFFAHLDATYGGTEAYLRQELGLSSDQIMQLRNAMLQ